MGNPWTKIIGGALQMGGGALSGYANGMSVADLEGEDPTQGPASGGADPYAPERVASPQRLSEIEPAPIGGNLQTELPQTDEDIIMRKKAALNSLSQGA